MPKRRDKKSLRVKVISLGNAEVGKVKDLHLVFGAIFVLSSVDSLLVVISNHLYLVY